MIRTSSFIFFILLLIAAPQTQFAQRTVRMNIERIVSDGAMIFRGTVTAVVSAKDPATDIVATFVTFSVAENFYGADQSSVTVKMLGGKTNRSTLRLAEMPTFTVGEEVIVSFFAPSRYGLTSPVGMAQGKFAVATDKTTKTKVVNATGTNPQLFKGLKHATALARTQWKETTVPSVSVEEFSQTIRSLVTILKK